MGDITWVRPSGTEITTNDSDETIKYAATLGWKPKDGDEKADKKTKADKKDK